MGKLSKSNKLSESLDEFGIPVSEDLFVEMSNLGMRDTGIPYVIWVMGRHNLNHGPRIKVSRSKGKMSIDDSFVMTIDDEPKTIGDVKDIPAKDLKMISDFVKINKDLLMQYWNMQILTRDFIDQIKKV